MPAINGSGSEKLLDLVECLQTTGARAVAPFSIDGNHYLAIPQLAEDIPDQPPDMTKGNMDVETLIFKHQKGQWQIWQRLPVSGGEDVEFFAIGDRKFLATASLRRGSGPYEFSMDSMIYEWRGSKFIPFQPIPTFGAKQWRYFRIEERHFLALAQGCDHHWPTDESSHESLIFEWDGSSFVPFQKIPSAWGYNWLHFNLDGDSFLAYADNVAPSVILRWDGVEFKQFQTLDGESGRAFCFFRAEGNAYLLFANLMGETILYQWRQGHFKTHQELSGPSGREFALYQQGAQTYVAQANFLTGSRDAPKTNLESVIYRFDRDHLIVADTFPTSGATDVTFLTIGEENFIAISESLSSEVRFRTDSHIYRFNPGCVNAKAAIAPVYQNHELLALYNTYTGGGSGIGANYSRIATKSKENDPLLVVTGTDIALFPGGGQPPSFQGFRLSTKGFKELAAISHLGPALASLISMRCTDPGNQIWRSDAERLLKATQDARRANSADLWSEKIAVEAYRGREKAIAAMIDYACLVTIRFLHAILDDESKATAQFLRHAYLEAKHPSLGLSIPFNVIMIATFFLVGLDTGYRVINWLQEQKVEWSRMMVLVCGRQGRATAGVTWNTNSVCQMILAASKHQLPLDRMYIAPHAPSFSIGNPPDIEAIRNFEQPMRTLWCYTRAMADLGPTMFEGYARYTPSAYEAPILTQNTTELAEMPRIMGPDDMLTMTTRLRLVMEDPRQLLAGCMTDYVIEQLMKNGNDPAKLVVPGLDRYDYPVGLQTRGYATHDAPLSPIKRHDLELRTQNGIEKEVDGPGIEDLAGLNFVDTDFAPSYRFLEVDNGRISWWESGRGDKTVLWIHGLPLDSRSWEAQRRHFSPLCRNIFIDLRGYGRSSKIPPKTPDVTALYCADLRALLDALHLNANLTIVGFASAGHVALRLASQLGPRIQRLVTINASPKFRRGPDWPWGFTDAGIAHFTDALTADGIAGLTSAVLDPALVFRDLPRPAAERLAAWFRPMSLNAGAETLRGFFEGISRDDDRGLLGQIAAETLVVVGGLGQEVPGLVGLYLRQHVPNARLVELAGADHFAFATRAQVVNDVIGDFVFRR